jgi:hypothetical protein
MDNETARRALRAKGRLLFDSCAEDCACAKRLIVNRQTLRAQPANGQTFSERME